jgi:hypothetical protein
VPGGNALESIAPKDVTAIKSNANLAVDEVPWYANCYFQLWFNATTPPFDNVTLRQAVLYAIDRVGMAKAMGLRPGRAFLLPVLRTGFHGVRRVNSQIRLQPGEGEAPGHRSPNSTLQYLKSSPTRLAKLFARAEYFERNLRSIDVLVPRGQTAHAEPWRYDLGHGYCRYEFFAKCPHRLACARCDYYEPKDSEEVLILEAEGNLVRLRQDLLLTDEEREAIDGDVLTFEKLRAKRWDIATPAGPSPHDLESASDVTSCKQQRADPYTDADDAK